MLHMQSGHFHLTWLTLGEVALASNGNNPPQAIIKLSANCDIICTVLTTKTALSDEFTNSRILFDE